MEKRNISPVFIVLIAMVVLRFVEGGFGNFQDWILSELLMLPGIVIGLSFHEFGHAFASNALGDPTPKEQGRLTINPAAHMDPFGFIALLLAGFGWGVPVEINPTYYKHRRLDEMIVAFAGVFVNFILAAAFLLLWKILITEGILMGSTGEIIAEIIYNTVLINIVLMVFNLLPVPPLDGFNIITEIFNLRKYSWYYPVYSKGGIILLLLVFLNVTDFLLTPGVNAVFSFLYHLII